MKLPSKLYFWKCIRTPWHTYWFGHICYHTCHFIDSIYSAFAKIPFARSDQLNYTCVTHGSNCLTFCAVLYTYIILTLGAGQERVACQGTIPQLLNHNSLFGKHVHPGPTDSVE